MIGSSEIGKVFVPVFIASPTIDPLETVRVK